MDDWELPSGHREATDLALDLADRIVEGPIGIVTVDGWSGSGKTTLAKSLAGHLGLQRYELDDYLLKHRGGFLEHLDYPRLSSALTDVRRVSDPILVDGICVLKVLQRLGLRSDVKVYVRRISASGIWYDVLKLDPSRTADEVIEEDRQAAERWAEMHGESFGEGGVPLAWEVIRYHYTYLPHETADLYFNRIERGA